VANLWLYHELKPNAAIQYVTTYEPDGTSAWAQWGADRMSNILGRTLLPPDCGAFADTIQRANTSRPRPQL